MALQILWHQEEKSNGLVEEADLLKDSILELRQQVLAIVRHNGLLVVRLPHALDMVIAKYAAGVNWVSELSCLHELSCGFELYEINRLPTDSLTGGSGVSITYNYTSSPSSLFIYHVPTFYIF